MTSVAAPVSVKPVPTETALPQIAPPPAQTGAIAAPARAETVAPSPPAPTEPPAPTAPKLAEGLAMPAPTTLASRCQALAERRQVASARAEAALAEVEKLLGSARKPGASDELNPRISDSELHSLLEKARALNGRARIAVEYGALAPAGARPSKGESSLAGRQAALADNIARLEEKLLCDAPDRAFTNNLRLVADVDSPRQAEAAKAPAAGEDD